MGLGNRQNKKAAPVHYTAGLITAFEGSDIRQPDYPTALAIKPPIARPRDLLVVF